MNKKTLVASALLTLFATTAIPSFSTAMDPLIEEQLARDGRVDVFVKMAAEPDSSWVRRIEDKVARRWAARDIRVALADRSQAALRDYLEARGVDFEVFWVNNSLLIRDADEELVWALAAFEGVAYLHGDERIPWHTPTEFRPATKVPAGIEWNIDRINAPAVWARGSNGEGIVVANVDTGVRYTHEALRESYRGRDGNHDYNWWDPWGNSPIPADNAGHGTHTMGTMVGDDGAGNQIGVAPGATWIAARACDAVFCSTTDLISAAQFLACPTDLAGNNPDCAKAPDIVNNSWAYPPGQTWYESYIEAYIDAGIIPVFAAGNAGPECESVGSPGNSRITLSVANITSLEQLSESSSRGPSPFSARPQPDISAPGTNVRSSGNASDTAYFFGTGTSMAAPHLVGALALLQSGRPDAPTRDVVEKLLLNACQDTLLSPAPPGFQSCGGVAWHEFPSNHYGWGRLDVGAAIGANTPCD